MLEYLFENDFEYQNHLSSLKGRLSETQNELDLAKLTAADVSEEVVKMQGALGEQHLLVTALVRIVVRAGLIKPQELTELIREIDLEDGQADGQLHEKRPEVPKWCRRCEARIRPGNTICLFCGERYDGAVVENMTRPQPQASGNPARCTDCGSLSPADSTCCVYCGLSLNA